MASGALARVLEQGSYDDDDDDDSGGGGGQNGCYGRSGGAGEASSSGQWDERSVRERLREDIKGERRKLLVLSLFGLARNKYDEGGSERNGGEDNGALEEDAKERAKREKLRTQKDVMLCVFGKPDVTEVEEKELVASVGETLGLAARDATGIAWDAIETIATKHRIAGIGRSNGAANGAITRSTILDVASERLFNRRCELLRLASAIIRRADSVDDEIFADECRAACESLIGDGWGNTIVFVTVAWLEKLTHALADAGLTRGSDSGNDNGMQYVATAIPAADAAAIERIGIESVMLIDLAFLLFYRRIVPDAETTLTLVNEVARMLRATTHTPSSGTGTARGRYWTAAVTDGVLPSISRVVRHANSLCALLLLECFRIDSLVDALRNDTGDDDDDKRDDGQATLYGGHILGHILFRDDVTELANVMKTWLEALTPTTQAVNGADDEMRGGSALHALVILGWIVALQLAAKLAEAKEDADALAKVDNALRHRESHAARAFEAGAFDALLHVLLRDERTEMKVEAHATPYKSVVVDFVAGIVTAFDVRPLTLPSSTLDVLVGILSAAFAGQTDLCNQLWDAHDDSFIPLRHFLNDCANMFPAFPMPFVRLLSSLADGHDGARAALQMLNRRKELACVHSTHDPAISFFEDGFVRCDAPIALQSSAQMWTLHAGALGRVVMLLPERPDLEKGDKSVGILWEVEKGGVFARGVPLLCKRIAVLVDNWRAFGAASEEEAKYEIGESLKLIEKLVSGGDTSISGHDVRELQSLPSSAARAMGDARATIADTVFGRIRASRDKDDSVGLLETAEDDERDAMAGEHSEEDDPSSSTIFMDAMQTVLASSILYNGYGTDSRCNMVHAMTLRILSNVASVAPSDVVRVLNMCYHTSTLHASDSGYSGLGAAMDTTTASGVGESLFATVIRLEMDTGTFAGVRSMLLLLTSLVQHGELDSSLVVSGSIYALMEILPESCRWKFADVAEQWLISASLVRLLRAWLVALMNQEDARMENLGDHDNGDHAQIPVHPSVLGLRTLLLDSFGSATFLENLVVPLGAFTSAAELEEMMARQQITVPMARHFQELVQCFMELVPTACSFMDAHDRSPWTIANVFVRKVRTGRASVPPLMLFASFASLSSPVSSSMRNASRASFSEAALDVIQAICHILGGRAPGESVFRKNLGEDGNGALGTDDGRRLRSCLRRALDAGFSVEKYASSRLLFSSAVRLLVTALEQQPTLAEALLFDQDDMLSSPLLVDERASIIGVVLRHLTLVPTQGMSPGRIARIMHVAELLSVNAIEYRQTGAAIRKHAQTWTAAEYCLRTFASASATDDENLTSSSDDDTLCEVPLTAFTLSSIASALQIASSDIMAGDLGTVVSGDGLEGFSLVKKLVARGADTVGGNGNALSSSSSSSSTTLGEIILRACHNAHEERVDSYMMHSLRRCSMILVEAVIDQRRREGRRGAGLRSVYSSILEQVDVRVRRAAEEVVDRLLDKSKAARSSRTALQASSASVSSVRETALTTGRSREDARLRAIHDALRHAIDMAAERSLSEGVQPAPALGHEDMYVLDALAPLEQCILSLCRSGDISRRGDASSSTFALASYGPGHIYSRTRFYAVIGNAFVSSSIKEARQVAEEMLIDLDAAGIVESNRAASLRAIAAASTLVGLLAAHARSRGNDGHAAISAWDTEDILATIASLGKRIYSISSSVQTTSREEEQYVAAYSSHASCVLHALVSLFAARTRGETSKALPSMQSVPALPATSLNRVEESDANTSITRAGILRVTLESLFSSITNLLDDTRSAETVSLLLTSVSTIVSVYTHVAASDVDSQGVVGGGESDFGDIGVLDALRHFVNMLIRRLPSVPAAVRASCMNSLTSSLSCGIKLDSLVVSNMLQRFTFELVGWSADVSSSRKNAGCLPENAYLEVLALLVSNDAGTAALVATHEEFMRMVLTAALTIVLSMAPSSAARSANLDATAIGDVTYDGHCYDTRGGDATIHRQWCHALSLLGVLSRTQSHRWLASASTRSAFLDVASAACDRMSLVLTHPDDVAVIPPSVMDAATVIPMYGVNGTVLLCGRVLQEVSRSLFFFSALVDEASSETTLCDIVHRRLPFAAMDWLAMMIAVSSSGRERGGIRFSPPLSATEKKESEEAIDLTCGGAWLTWISVCDPLVSEMRAREKDGSSGDAMAVVALSGIGADAAPRPIKITGYTLARISDLCTTIHLAALLLFKVLTCETLPRNEPLLKRIASSTRVLDFLSDQLSILIAGDTENIFAHARSARDTIDALL